MIGEALNIELIEITSKEDFKAGVKNKIRNAALNDLNKVKESHSKVKHIKFTELKMQEYLKSPTFTDEETSLLFALRSRTNESFKANFRNLYNNVVPCPLDCWENEETVEDTQPHLLVARN